MEAIRLKYPRSDKNDGEILDSEPIVSYSWTVLSDTLATKKSDMSVFLNMGTGIPVEIRPFFGIESFAAGDKRPTVLIYKGKEYRATLERIRSTAEQTRLMWHSDLRKVFKNDFPQFAEIPIDGEERNYPILKFEKLADDRYLIWFERGIDYIRLERDVKEDLSKDDFTSAGPIIEGKPRSYYGTRYERNQKNRLRAIEIHGLKCAVCGFDFEETYGEVGRNFIEVHHVKPLFEGEGPIEVDAETDLVCVCSNCHRMIHRKKDRTYTIEELRNMIHDSGCISEIDGQMIMMRMIKWD